MKLCVFCGDMLEMREYILQVTLILRPTLTLRIFRKVPLSISLHYPGQRSSSVISPRSVDTWT